MIPTGRRANMPMRGPSVPHCSKSVRINPSGISHTVSNVQKTYHYRAAALTAIALSAELTSLTTVHPIIPVAIAACSLASTHALSTKHCIIRHKTWLLFNTALGASLAPFDVTFPLLLAANVNLGYSVAIHKTLTWENLAGRYAAVVVLSTGFHAALQTHMGSVALAGLGMTCFTFFEAGRLLHKASEENYDPLNGSLGLKNPS